MAKITNGNPGRGISRIASTVPCVGHVPVRICVCVATAANLMPSQRKAAS